MLVMFYEASAVFYEIYEVFEACDGRTCASAGARRAPGSGSGRGPPDSEVYRVN